MDVNIGIDSKPRTRRGRRRFSDRPFTLPGDRNGDTNDPADSNRTLNVRVKERENSGSKKGALGSIFKDTPTTAIKSLFHKESNHNIKGSIKRPLTGLFRRPSSRANSKHQSKNKNRAETDIIVPEISICKNGYSQTPRLAAPCFEGVLHDVANAPSMNVHQVPAVDQVDYMNEKSISLTRLGDIDLSLLSRFLCLKEEVNDEEVSWTWDYLFAGVSSEMRDEWVRDEECEDGDYEDGNLAK